MQNWMGGCLCDNWKPTFLPRFIFNWSTFLRQVTALWWRRWAESQVSTNQNLRNRWCQIVRQTTVYHGEVHFFNFRPEILFLRKFGPKIKNCLFKVKFVTKTNSNMQNSMAMFTFSVFDRKYCFLGKLDPKIQNCSFKVKFVT